MGQSTMTFPRIVFLSAFLIGCSYSQSSGEDNSGSDTRDCTTQQREDCGPNANCFFKPKLDVILCVCQYGGVLPNCHEPGPADSEPQYGCGGENVPTTSASGDYITGGSVTAPNQYPWMVRVLSSLAGCGGTLISNRHVITAYHCVKSYGDLYIGTVKLGAHDQYNSSAYQEVEVEDAYFPPGEPLWKDTREPMNPDGCHDLAILLLKEPVKFSTTIQPVCLPDDLVHVGQKAMAMGWGETEDGGLSELLKHLDVEIITTKDIFGGYCKDNFFLTGKEFASSGVLEHGDSGGPLVYKDPMTESWKIIGVASSRGTDTNTWNKVTAYLDWINGILAEQRTM